MTQCGENCEQNQEIVEEVTEKKPLNIRIAIFYDGTLNNRINIDEREKDSKIYEEFRVKGKPSSYDNGRTNIAIMEPHLIAEKEQYPDYEHVFKVYIEGQGTFDLEGDSLQGYALGGGESGVADRADKGIQWAINKIFKNDEINPLKHYIKKLTVDVFGFSRGSATARYAIHLLLNGDDDWFYGYDAIHTRLQEIGYDIDKCAVEICFAGLYDTVLSYYGSQLFKRTSNVLEQKAVKLAKKTLHLAAADEHRKDFPVHNINSAKSKGGEEYYLPGVHSDIGGSYNQASERALQAETDESKKVYMEVSNEENIIINEGYNNKEIVQDRNYLIAQGWYTESEITIEEKRKRRPGPHHLNIYRTKYYLKVERLNIHSGYCNIPLKIMAEYARKPDVKLKLNTKLERRANKIINAEDDLKSIEGIIKNYIASNKNSKPEDWIGEKAALNTPELKKIRNRHFHFSSKIGPGYGPLIVKGKRTRFIYDA